MLHVNGGTIPSARVGLTGATSHALRLANVEQALAGRQASATALEAAAKLAGADLDDVNADLHASEEYRRAMIPVFRWAGTGTALARK